jgi:predicted permease
LSYLFWKKQYGASPDILGKTIELDHVAYTVIGIAPPRFTWGDSDVYRIAQPNSDPHNYYNVFLRIKPGVSHEVLAAELQPLVNRFAQQDTANFPQNSKVTIVTLNDEIMGHFKGALLFLFAAVLLLLFIGCANVSILLLARGSARQHEFAIRSSIGAGRGRMVRQLLTESVLLSLLGAALGVLMAYQGVDLIAAHLPTDSFPHEASAGIHVNGYVLLFSTGLAVFTGILFGLSPAWQLSRPQSGPQLGQIMQAGSVKLAGKANTNKTHMLLIVGQVALTMLLLATAGAAIRGFLKLYHTPLGFDPDHVFVLSITLPKNNSEAWQQRANLQESLRQAATQTPGVSGISVSTTWYPPLNVFTAKIDISNLPNRTDAQAGVLLASPDILSTLRIPLLSGRNFTAQETATAAHVATVNQAFVRQFFPGGNPIGQSVRCPRLKDVCNDCLKAADAGGWFQIVGVLGDARNDGLVRPTLPAVFLPYTVVLPPNIFLVGRAASDPDIAMRTIGERLHKQNPGIYVSQQRQMSWMLENQAWATEHFLANLFGIFAFLALALAATGLYSVVSYSASQRTQEIGIRMALGAPRSSVMRLVLESSLLTVTIGAATGLALALALNHSLSNVIQGGSNDPLTLLTVACVLLLVAAIACSVPALHAARLDPMRALREE